MEKQQLLEELGKMAQQVLQGLITDSEFTNAAIDKLALAGFVPGAKLTDHEE